MLKLLFIFVVAMMPVSAVAGNSVVVTSTTSSVKEDVAVKAVQAFLAACSPLADKYWSDVVSAKAKAYETYASYRVRDYGWPVEIEVEIQLKENPSSIPDTFQAWGHRVSYFIGGGKKPGIIAQKRQAQALCGMVPDPNGKDVFKSVPGMTVIDGK